MVKVNLEMDEKEAKKYFRKKHIFKLPKIKKVNPNLLLLAVVIMLGGIVFFMFIDNLQKSEYKRGYDSAKNDIIYEQSYQELEEKSLNYVWEWFAKRALITLGCGLPLLLLVMATVWIIHGSFFKLM